MPCPSPERSLLMYLHILIMNLCICWLIDLQLLLINWEFVLFSFLRAFLAVCAHLCLCL